jgi:tRNA(Ile)-lysidine synthase
LEYVTDSTNESKDYLRNCLRADVIPSLEEIAPHSHRQILRTCASLREDDEYLCLLADGLLKNALTPDGALALESLNDAPSPLRKRAVIRWVRSHAPLLRLQGCHVDALCDLIDTGRGKTCLPDGWSASVQNGLLRLRLDRDQSLPPVAPYEWRAPLAVGTICTDFGVHLTLAHRGETAADTVKNAKNPQNVYNTFIRDTLSFDTIVQDAYFRPRAAGDLLLLRGMHRKVRKLQNQAGIPPALRHRLPVLCDERGILWVPFVGVRDDFPVVPPESAEYLLTLSVDAPLISCL